MAEASIQSEMMNRRNFLKGCFISLSLLFVPKMLFANKKYFNFNPELYYGNFVEMNDMLSKNKAIKIAEADMKKIIPPEYRHRVKTILKPLGCYGTIDPLYQRGTFGWKYIPENPLLSKGLTKKMATDPLYGWGNDYRKPIAIIR